ncbi:MAG: hypothetical protein ACK5Y2_04000 [Bdellovibrionales bacterium]
MDEVENAFVTIKVYKILREPTLNDYNEDVYAEELFSESQSVKISKIRFRQDDIIGTQFDLEKEIEVEGVKKKVALKLHIQAKTHIDADSKTWREWPVHISFESYLTDSPDQNRTFSFASELDGSQVGFSVSGKAFTPGEPFSINMLGFGVKVEFTN